MGRPKIYKRQCEIRSRTFSIKIGLSKDCGKQDLDSLKWNLDHGKWNLEGGKQDLDSVKWNLNLGK